MRTSRAIASRRRPSVGPQKLKYPGSKEEYWEGMQQQSRGQTLFTVVTFVCGR